VASIRWGKVFRLCRPLIACCVGFDSRLHNLLVEAIQSELPRPSHRSETRPSADKTLLLEPTFCRLGSPDRDLEKEPSKQTIGCFGLFPSEIYYGKRELDGATLPTGGLALSDVNPAW
jgi:hypothetical protein